MEPSPHNFYMQNNQQNSKQIPYFLDLSPKGPGYIFRANGCLIFFHHISYWVVQNETLKIMHVKRRRIKPPTPIQNLPLKIFLSKTSAICQAEVGGAAKLQWNIVSTGSKYRSFQPSSLT